MDKNEYMRKWYAGRVSVMREKLGGCCTVCGGVDNLEIDHIDPATKTASVTTLWNRPWIEIDKELEKCQLLCAAHHREKSSREGSQVKNRMRGEDNGSSKLNWSLVSQIRQMYRDGLSIKYEIVPKVGVTRYSVMRVIQNKTWVDPHYHWEPRAKNATKGLTR